MGSLVEKAFEVVTAAMAGLAAIPAVFWGALIGGALTVTGVLISNRDNTRRLKLQLEHDATQRNLERTSAIRRDVYLQTAAAFSKAMRYLSLVANLDLSKPELWTGLSEFQIEAAKLQLVAEPQTALLIDRLGLTLAEAHNRLYLHLVPMQMARDDLKLKDDTYNRALTEYERALAEISKISASGQPNDRALAALTSMVDSSRKAMETNEAERVELRRKLNTLHCDFLPQLSTEFRTVSNEAGSLLLEMRRDLGFSVEHRQEWTNQMEQMWPRAKAQHDATIQTMKDLEILEP